MTITSTTAQSPTKITDQHHACRRDLDRVPDQPPHYFNGLAVHLMSLTPGFSAPDDWLRFLVFGAVRLCRSPSQSRGERTRLRVADHQTRRGRPTRSQSGQLPVKSHIVDSAVRRWQPSRPNRSRFHSYEDV